MFKDVLQMIGKTLYLCDFENCQIEGNLKIIITIKETFDRRRARFCCIEHAIGWLQARLPKGEQIEKNE